MIPILRLSLLFALISGSTFYFALIHWAECPIILDDALRSHQWIDTMTFQTASPLQRYLADYATVVSMGVLVYGVFLISLKRHADKRGLDLYSRYEIRADLLLFLISIIFGLEPQVSNSLYCHVVGYMEAALIVFISVLSFEYLILSFMRPQLYKNQIIKDGSRVIKILKSLF